jgi:hypothetical protein
MSFHGLPHKTVRTVSGAPVCGRPLWILENGDILLGGDAGGIARFSPNTGVLQLVCGSPFSTRVRVAALSRLGARLLRLGPRAFVLSDHGTMIWTAGGRLWRCPQGESLGTSILGFEYGSGPLFLAKSSDNILYFGDYVATRERHQSRVWSSHDDGQSWEVAAEFAIDRVRHIHGVFWDSYSKQLWLTTGDSDSESGLWVLDGGHAREVVGGSQRFRIVQPVFSAGAIYFGTDTPGQNCGIYRLDRLTLKAELLEPTCGPTFFGTRTSGHIIFSTVVEPGHPVDQAALYVGDETNGAFAEVSSFVKDRWHMQLFQYGQIFLPANAGAGETLFFTPCATSGDYRLHELGLLNNG